MRQATAHRAADPLSLKIYAALLGERPRIDRLPKRSIREGTLREQAGALLGLRPASPFHQPTVREHLGRCVGSAAQALEEARGRLRSARPAPRADVRPAPAGPRQIVLVGPAALFRDGDAHAYRNAA